MLKRLLRRENKGIGAVEFALVAPVLISFVIGISQMGKLFFANADIKNAMASGARVASVWPVPDDATILAAVNDRLARTGGVTAADVEIERDVDDNGNSFIEIKADYSVPLDFIFFDVGPITLRDSRLVFIQVANANTTTYTATSASTSTTTGGTTTGGTTTGGTTTGGTTTGGTTTGGTTTGGTTTGGTTTGGTTSSGNGNGNGNSNGNSSHGHGNCSHC